MRSHGIISHGYTRMKLCTSLYRHRGEGASDFVTRYEKESACLILLEYKTQCCWPSHTHMKSWRSLPPFSSIRNQIASNIYYHYWQRKKTLESKNSEHHNTANGLWLWCAVSWNCTYAQNVLRLPIYWMQEYMWQTSDRLSGPHHEFVSSYECLTSRWIALSF
jgi:hypothetical protein